MAHLQPSRPTASTIHYTRNDNAVKKVGEKKFSFDLTKLQGFTRFIRHVLSPVVLLFSCTINFNA